MSKQSEKPVQPKKPTSVPNFTLPPGFEFPMYPGFPSFEEMMEMKPLPGMEEEFAMAIKTLESVCNTDFTKSIDLENVCGHGGPGIEMKEGYCLTCYESEGIGQLVEMLDLADKFGPDSAVTMMNPPCSSTFPKSSQGDSKSSKETKQKDTAPSRKN